MAVTLLLPAVGHTDEWTAQAGVDVHYKSSDNVRLQTENPVSTQGVVTAPYVNGRWRTETSEISANLDLEFEKYDKQRFNSDNQDLTIRASHRFEHNTLTVQGVYDRDSTLSTELRDTGRVEDGASRRVKRQIKPEWQWQMTQRQSLDTTLSYENTRYDSTEYTDYHFSRVDTTWVYLLTERWQLQIQPYASRYKSQDQPRTIQSDTYGLQSGFLWQLSEHLKWSALAGMSRQKTEYKPPLYTFRAVPYPPYFIVGVIKGDKSNAFVGQTDVAWTGEYWSVHFNASSSEQPSGDGGVRQFTRAGLGFGWKPLQHMRVDLNTLAGKNTSSSSQNITDRTFASAKLQLSWQVAEQWWVRTSYQYRRQKYANASDSATDNAVYLTVSWTLPRQVR